MAACVSCSAPHCSRRPLPTGRARPYHTSGTGILQNDTVPCGSAVTVELVTDGKYGKVTLGDDDGFQYEPAGDLTDDQFKYSITCEGLTSTATVYLPASPGDWGVATSVFSRSCQPEAGRCMYESGAGPPALNTVVSCSTIRPCVAVLHPCRAAARALHCCQGQQILLSSLSLYPNCRRCRRHIPSVYRRPHHRVGITRRTVGGFLLQRATSTTVQPLLWWLACSGCKCCVFAQLLKVGSHSF